jgi:hypothetical protein
LPIKGYKRRGKYIPPEKYGVKHVTDMFEIEIRDFHPGKKM